MNYPIVVYRDAFTAKPIVQEALPWSEIFSEITNTLVELPSCPADTPQKDQKRHLLSFGPYSLKPGGKRGVEGVESLSLLVLDIDNLEHLTLDELLATLSSSELNVIVYESPSSTREEPRVRVVIPLDAPVAPEHSKQIRYAFVGWLGLSPACGVARSHEASRLFYLGRLHGTPERRVWAYSGEPIDSAWLLEQPIPQEPEKLASTSPLVTICDHTLARAHALASRMPPSIEGHGGDNALFQVTRELGTVLGEDADAIQAVLEETFNPRCLPPWPTAKLAYEAKRVAKHQSTPEARAQRRLDRTPLPYEAANPWRAFASFTSPEEPIQYLCEGLRLAPSWGKISIIAGAPNGAKGPLADHIAVCVALGIPVFSHFACKQAKVLLIDFEGARLTMRRLRRMARGLGRKPAELEGQLLLVDASTVGDMTSPENLDALSEIVDSQGVGLVVLDSYTTAMLSSEVDFNSPQFARLARALGRLGTTVLAVAHASKGTGEREPRLSDIAYSGAFGALAQTALVVHYDDPEDKNSVTVSCARAPETPFLRFAVRFSDAPGDALKVRMANAGQSVGPRETRRLEKKVVAIGSKADHVERTLRSVDVLRQGMSATKLKRAVGITTADWGAVLEELLKRGSVKPTGLPSENDVKYVIEETLPP